MEDSYLKKEVILQGKVISGSNQGKKFVNLPWVKKQIKLKLGFDPYLGTLNLHICEEKNLIELYQANGIIIEPEKGYYSGKCFKALIMTKIKGAVVLPNMPEYPHNLLELIAPINLRKEFQLKDEDVVEVQIII